MRSFLIQLGFIPKDLLYILHHKQENGLCDNENSNHIQSYVATIIIYLYVC